MNIKMAKFVDPVAFNLFLNRHHAAGRPGNSRHFPVVGKLTEVKDRDDYFHYCWKVKNCFKLVWMESTSSADLPHRNSWPFAEAALLVIGLTLISFDKNQF
jgi:hypothetical protein